MNSIGVYIHVPFCEHKCKYCNFTSSIQNVDVQKQYFFHLKNEIIGTNKKHKSVSSIFFGGGTPSCVDSNLITETLNIIKNNFDVLPNVEITLEANPNSTTLEKLTQYFKSGFNRISFGVQSFCDKTLEKLGRLHTNHQTFESIDLARKVGFSNISIDLILGVDKIDEIEFEKNIQQIKSLGVTHISAYILQLEQKTPLFFEVKSGVIKILDEEDILSQYQMVQNILEKNGYLQYEISNFALKNYESKHNQNYWACGEYLGFGVSAHSYFENVRSENISDLKKYFANEKEKFDIEVLTPEQKIEEYVMLALRTTKGINLINLKKLGCNLLKEKQNTVERLQKNGFIQIKDNHLFIKKEKFGVSNQIILELF